MDESFRVMVERGRKKAMAVASARLARPGQEREVRGGCAQGARHRVLPRPLVHKPGFGCATRVLMVLADQFDVPTQRGGGTTVPDEVVIVVSVFEGGVGQIPEIPHTLSEEVPLGGREGFRFEDRVNEEPPG